MGTIKDRIIDAIEARFHIGAGPFKTKEEAEGHTVSPDVSDQKTEQKPDHEKRIREALCLADQDEELITVVASRDLRALLADLDAMRGCLKQAASEY